MVIYPDRQTERINELHFRDFVQLPGVTRIYINELSSLENAALPVKLLRLITEPETTAPNLATELADQARVEISDLVIQENLINLLETIIVYKLPQKSREEIAAMFTMSDLKQTRFYQEVFAEGEAEGKAEGKAEAQKLAILRMFNMELPSEQIALFLDLPVAEVEATIAATAATIAAATAPTDTIDETNQSPQAEPAEQN